MARSWQDIFAESVARGDIDADRVRSAVAEIEREIAEYSATHIDGQALSPRELAAHMNLSESGVLDRIERWQIALDAGRIPPTEVERFRRLWRLEVATSWSPEEDERLFQTDALIDRLSSEQFIRSVIGLDADTRGVAELSDELRARLTDVRSALYDIVERNSGALPTDADVLSDPVISDALDAVLGFRSYRVTARCTRDPDTGMYAVDVQEIDGLLTQARTLNDARPMVVDAARLLGVELSERNVRVLVR